MNEQQFKRYSKLFSEAFYLLDRKHLDNKYEFTVSGSTKNVYLVTVGNDRKLFCTCPDAKSWAKKCNCICKHCLFVLYRVLKIFDCTDVPFFTNLVLCDDEWERVSESYKLLDAYVDPELINEHLNERYQDVDVGEFESKQKINADDLCGICYLSLEETSAEFVTCPTCKKSTHKECMNKWIDAGNKICVYCRSEVWKTFRQNGGKYRNLN